MTDFPRFWEVVTTAASIATQTEVASLACLPPSREVLPAPCCVPGLENGDVAGASRAQGDSPSPGGMRPVMEKTGLRALRKAVHRGRRCWGWSLRVTQAVFWPVVAGWAVAMTPDAAWPSAIKSALPRDSQRLGMRSWAQGHLSSGRAPWSVLIGRPQGYVKPGESSAGPSWRPGRLSSEQPQTMFQNTCASLSCVTKHV